MPKKRHPAEPFRIKSVEPINLLSRDKREAILKDSHFNVFRIKAEDVFVDLLTDSGTGAMSNEQWAAIMRGDESYAGAKSFYRLENAVKELTGKKHVIPVHQGRVAENAYFSTILSRGDYVLSNTHFDTTRANVQHKGGLPVDFPCPESMQDEEVPFKGNMDVEQLSSFIEEKGTEKIKAVFMTITNNSMGGQPVSMNNIRETSQVCRKYGLPFMFDCARFAENAWFIKTQEPGYQDKPVKAIAQEMFSYVDGALMSAKKDGLANMGGFIVVNDDELARGICELLIVIEGFTTYGGMSGRDIEAMAVGLQEVLNEDYLAYRVGQIEYFGKIIEEAGAPIIRPAGGHAIFVDAGRLLPHIPPDEFPGQALAVELYREGGVRGVEIGSLMFGGYDPNTGEKLIAKKELVRLAVPRRVYTSSHLDYVADSLKNIVARKDRLRGFKIKRQATYLRHFTVELEELAGSKVKAAR